MSNEKKSFNYISCMKINGVPLLPPVLTDEYRKEMQYYKLLAVAVESKINDLQSIYSLNEIESLQEGLPDSCDYISLGTLKQNVNETNDLTDLESGINGFESIISDVTVIDASSKQFALNRNQNSMNFVLIQNKNIDVIRQNQNNLHSHNSSPEVNKLEKDSSCGIKPSGLSMWELDFNREILSNPDRGPSCDDKKRFSLNDEESIIKKVDHVNNLNKTFTGSLNDIPTEIHSLPKLVRQRSYTIENPSPLLLAHLEVQSLTSGVDVSSISMSESCTNLPSKAVKDLGLELTKVKWSSMATDLQSKNSNGDLKTSSPLIKTKNNSLSTTANTPIAKFGCSDVISNNPSYKNQSKSKDYKQVHNYNKFGYISCKNSKNDKPLTTSSPIKKSPITSPKNNSPSCINSPDKIKKLPPSKLLPSNKICIQEIFHKIQSEQSQQMDRLLEKQKQEQILLQAVFEEQKKLLIDQLKLLTPGTTVNENKDEWVIPTNQATKQKLGKESQIEDKTTNASYYLTCTDLLNEGRMVLSQSINNNDIEQSSSSAEIKSCDINPPVNLRTILSEPLSHLEYCGFTEGSFTDRTNDTLADMTFCSESVEDDKRKNDENKIETKFENEKTSSNLSQCNSDVSKLSRDSKNRDILLKYYNNNHSSRDFNMINSKSTARKLFEDKKHSPQEREAASKIVAYCKGYLVRRLFRTERVQATVQTIRDALLCALQLHQDRKGITGADINLHRRLIQQITAACYSIHDTFIESCPEERCQIIKEDRERRKAAVMRQKTFAMQERASTLASKRNFRKKSDVMSISHMGVFARRSSPPISSSMSKSSYEMFDDKSSGSRSSQRYLPSSRELNSRQPWR